MTAEPTRPSIRAIVFDFDGVVVDSEPLYEKAENRLFEQYGIQVPPEDWKQFKGMSERDFLQLIRQKYGIPAKTDTLRQLGRSYLREVFAAELDYMPGFLEFYRKIKSSYTIGLVTSSARDIIEWVFGNTAVQNHFEYLLTGEDTQNNKPHPEPYLMMARRIGIEAQAMLVIEDSINGVRSASASGARTIGFLSGMSVTDLAAAEFHARDYGEVWQILQDLRESGQRMK